MHLLSHSVRMWDALLTRSTRVSSGALLLSFQRSSRWEEHKEQIVGNRPQNRMTEERDVLPTKVSVSSYRHVKSSPLQVPPLRRNQSSQLPFMRFWRGSGVGVLLLRSGVLPPPPLAFERWNDTGERSDQFIGVLLSRVERYGRAI